MRRTPNPQILQSIKDFLDAGSSPPQPRKCRQCGSAMQFINAHFVLGTATNCNLSLPVCPVCDREVMETLPCPETIH